MDPQPSWHGYSTGRWEGDTLVVESNGFRDGLWLDMSGTPLTDAATITERLTRPNYGTLEHRVHGGRSRRPTRAPGPCSSQQTIVVDTDLIEEICLEGLKPLHLPPQ